MAKADITYAKVKVIKKRPPDIFIVCLPTQNKILESFLFFRGSISLYSIKNQILEFFIDSFSSTYRRIASAVPSIPSFELQRHKS